MGTLSDALAPHAGRSANQPRVYVDANMPAGLVAFMRSNLKWDVLFVIEHDDLRRARDDAHNVMARQLRRTLITLDRDYRVVTYLLHNTAAYLDLGPRRFVLTVDFHLMRLCYRVLRGVSRQMSKRIVFEMAVIVGHLAQYAGERLVERRA